MQKPRDWREGMKHSSTAQTMRHLRVEVMELCEGAGLYQIDLLNGSKERVSEAEYWARRRGQMKLDRENAALTATGQQPRQKKFETVKDTLRKQISSVLYRSTSYEDFSDRLLQQYGIAVKESRGQLSYLPAGRTKFIRAKHLGDKFDKAAVLATLQANAERKPKAQFKQDIIGKLIQQPLRKPFRRNCVNLTQFLPLPQKQAFVSRSQSGTMSANPTLPVLKSLCAA